ncbi:fl(2)d-associated complex component-like [Sitodiplosis mosellana]|uniref:fl(2)d-associated complex component-like n=1 Tax=Sitodiplosis mosellana TaxID=263140 RepID=UPI002444266D|nr:fl(2)d-associated complex component-like [Sitodiplosis mosellana]
MSKAVKRKVSVELQKPSSKSRLSVFERLGTKKSKSLSESLSAAVSITTKPIKPDAVELEDADPDILEKKREEIRKELQLQMKMDSRRKRKHAESSSSSSSSSGSDSESSSSTSSSSSSDNRHKARKLKSKRRDSSSSDEYAKKLAKKKRACQSKKEVLKLHKISKKHEIVSVSRKAKKRSPSPQPLAKKHRTDVSDKHHRIREKEVVERSELLQRSERERMRLREERIRSRSPKIERTRSRTPKRERSPVLRRSPSDKRNRSLSRRMIDSEHERREKEREIAREKERREALLRCQERQRERERLATKSDSKSQRLLPRPAERAMALAAAQERNTEKEVGYGTSNRSSFGERSESFEHRRHDKDAREHDRSTYDKYDSHSRREPTEYQHSSSYRREWHDESSSSKDIYERSTEHQSTTRDWADHKRSENVRAGGDYSDRKEWNESTPKWADTRKPPTEKYDRRANDYAPHTSGGRGYSERSESFDPNSTSSVSSKPIAGSSIRGRWNSSWRGRGRGSHHSDFRRPHHHHTEILEERGEIYRRHINPQGTSLTTKPGTATKPSSENQPLTPTEKSISEDGAKSTNPDENPDGGEEIADDDLSEISDEADDILGQQEDANAKTQPKPVESTAEKSITEESKESTTQLANEEKKTAEKSIDQNDCAQQVRENLTPAKSPEEATDRSKDLSDDIDLDFEEISDGELEEEARTKGLGDALGVDWASLVEESKAMMREKLTKSETSAKQRWHPDQILLDVGISYKMAGTAFAQQTLIAAHENVKRELKNAATIKTEPDDDNSTNHMDVDIKVENDIDDNDTKETKVNGKCEDRPIEKDERKLILHPLPCVQTSVQNFADKQRKLIFKASGPYSRGLCTKRDIEMRRQLCNLAINESNCKSVNTRTGYENIALKLFQKAMQA